MEILILVVVVGVAIVAVAWTRGKPRPAPGVQPTCGGCGYSVIGLRSLVCPECGGDLRQVGIRPPGVPPHDPRFVPIFMIILLAGWAALLFLYAALDMLPRVTTLERTTQLRQPRSAGYLGADVMIGAKAWSGRPPRIRSRVTLRTTGGKPPSSRFEVDVLTGGYAYDTPDGKRVSAGGGFGTEAVLGWMKLAGLDATDPRVREEATSIAIEARRGALLRLNDGWPKRGGGRSIRSGGGELGFGNVTVLESSQASASIVHVFAAAAMTIGSAAAAIVYLIRRTRPAGSRQAAPS